jgi:ATP-binding cassette, subfamily B, bacterial MsbA
MKMLNPFGPNPSFALLARRYHWTAAVVMVLAVVIGFLEGIGIGLLIPLLSTFTAKATTPLGGAVGMIARIADGHDRTERLLIVSSLILFFVLLKSAFQIAENVFLSWIDGRLGHDLRSALSERLHAVGYSFFLVQDPARLLNALATESWKAHDAVRVLLRQIAASGTVVIFAALLVVVSWRLFFFVALGGLITRLVQKQTEGRLRKLSTQTVSTYQALADRELFAVFGARIIRLFNQQKPEHRRFQESSNEARLANFRTDGLAGAQGPLLEAMHGVLFVVVLLIAMFTGTSLPVLAAFLVLMNRLQPHLRTLEQSGALFASAAGHFSEVEWLLAPGNKPPAPGGDRSFQGLNGDIVFENVTFDYGSRGEPALHNATFVLRRGRATALMGGSGAGKSTVINLLCRLLEPGSGAIKIGPQSLSTIKVSEWLDALAIAGQDIDLIDGTIAENIAYGRPGTSLTKIQDAVRAAHATFIDQLPQGLETLVGPRGLSLSGGQRQRVGIARALAREPQLLILDEATNAVDHDTELGILETLQSARTNMTIVVISHRMSTLNFCDDAIVLDRGKVVKEGPFATTLGYYEAQSADATGSDPGPTAPFPARAHS